MPPDPDGGGCRGHGGGLQVELSRPSSLVCSMRGIPIFTFMNKLESHDWRLVAELEEVLGIDAYPMNYWRGWGKTYWSLMTSTIIEDWNYAV